MGGQGLAFLCLACTYTVMSTVIAAEGRDRCFRQVSDVVIAIDSSFSIRSWEFKEQLSFLKNLIDSFTIGQNHMQLGVVSYGSKVRMEIPLNAFQDKEDLKTAVETIDHMDSGTYTGEAIRFVHSQMFKERNGGRPWAKRILLLITDGVPLDPKKTLLEASRARRKGVEIFSIGVGPETDMTQLKVIASDPKADHVFHVRGYDSLSGIKAALTDAACDTLQNDEAQTWPHLVECKQKAADIFFLMDSSNSIWGPDFDKYIGFVRNVTSNYDIGPDNVRVGLTVYTDKPIQLLSFSDTQSQSHLNRVLTHTQRVLGGSNTARAIHHTRKFGFTEYTKRSNCAKIMVILTDGQSDVPELTAREAKLAHQEGIRIFTIGVGRNTNSAELMAMASDPDDQHVFHVDEFDGLNSIRDLLLVKTCDAVQEMVPNDGPKEPVECPTKPTDAVFIYDTTSLSLHYHNIVLNSISRVIEAEHLISSNLRFGVFRESSRTKTPTLQDIKLTAGSKKNDILTKLDPGSAKSAVQILLRKARRIWDDEWSHKRIVFLFLESDLRSILGASLESTYLRNSGVRVVVVGLGPRFNSNQALYLATHPARQNLIIHKQEESENNGQELVDKILQKLCEE